MEDLVNQQARSTSDPPEPSRPDHPASFFFLGALQPAEQANFNLQNIVLPGEDAVLEVFGHGVAVWWRQRVRSDFEDVRDATRDWLETIVAIYYLCSGTALDVHLAHWVETLANVEEAVVGFIDEPCPWGAAACDTATVGEIATNTSAIMPAGRLAWARQTITFVSTARMLLSQVHPYPFAQLFVGLASGRAFREQCRVQVLHGVLVRPSHD
jgi:hypothetical protein